MEMGNFTDLPNAKTSVEEAIETLEKEGYEVKKKQVEDPEKECYKHFKKHIEPHLEGFEWEFQYAHDDIYKVTIKLNKVFSLKFQADLESDYLYGGSFQEKGENRHPNTTQLIKNLRQLIK